MTRIYPLLTHSSSLNTPTLAWYFLFSQLRSFTSLQKNPSQNSRANPCMQAGYFCMIEVSKNISFVETFSPRIRDTAAAYALGILFFFSPFNTSDKFPQVSGTSNADSRTEERRATQLRFRAKGPAQKERTAKHILRTHASWVTSQLPFRKSKTHPQRDKQLGLNIQGSSIIMTRKYLIIFPLFLEYL